MEYKRLALLQWSEFIKISKFAKQIGISPQAASQWLRYGASSLSEEKKTELYELILEYMRANFA